MVTLLILVIYLTPLIPLSFKGEGEVYVGKGLTPLRASLSLWGD